MRIYVVLAHLLACWPLAIQAEEPPLIWAKTVEEWIVALREDRGSDQDRDQAVRALGYFGPGARDAVPDLIAIFARPNGKPNVSVIETLGRIGPDAALAVPLLVAQFAKEECTLGKQGTFITLRYGDLAIALTRIGGPAVAAVAKLLEDPNEEIHPCAASILADIGPEARTAVPALIRAIEKPTPRYGPSTQLHATRALGRIGPDARAAIPTLNARLDRALSKHEVDDVDDHRRGLDAVGAPPVAKLLDQVLRKGDWATARYLGESRTKSEGSRSGAAQGPVGHARRGANSGGDGPRCPIAPPAREAIPVLIDVAGPRIVTRPRRKRTIALGRLGPAAHRSDPKPDPLLRAERMTHEALVALVQIDVEGRELCSELIIAALRSDDDNVVNTAAECLSLLGPKAKNAVPALAKALSHDFGEASGNFNARVSVARALARMGPESRSAIPALIAALKDELTTHSKAEQPGADLLAAEAFARALGSFGPAARAAVPLLVDVLKSQEQAEDRWVVRVEAALTLGRIGPEAAPAIPLLRDAVFWKQFPEISEAAAIALARLAPDGKDLAEKWARASTNLKSRARVLGALGQSSFEGDYWTREYLRTIDSLLESRVVRDGQTIWVEDWLISLGDLEWGAHLAIPRLTRATHHSNPWVRLWAREALARIVRHRAPAGD